jgi:electron transfer flavoprotein beta subunit
MKALVAVKRVIDYHVKIRVNDDGSDVDLSNVKMAMNPFCEIAVEEAVRLREAGIVDEVVVVSVGEKTCEEQIRNALALGADRGVRVDYSTAMYAESMTQPDALTIAKLLSKVVEREQPELTILGKQAIDSDNNQTGQMLAALLDYPQATFVSELQVTEQGITATREVDGGLQVLQLPLPAVITTDLRLNEPRYASLPNIMKAKRKPIDVVTAEELGVELRCNLLQLSVETPAQRSAGIKVASVTELVDKLRNEAKVL